MMLVKHPKSGDVYIVTDRYASEPLHYDDYMTDDAIDFGKVADINLEQPIDDDPDFYGALVWMADIPTA
jgi:hypothetical protein